MATSDYDVNNSPVKIHSQTWGAGMGGRSSASPMARLPDGRICHVTDEINAGDDSLNLWVSDDDGATWSEVISDLNTTTGAFENISVAVDEDSHLWVFYGIAIAAARYSQVMAIDMTLGAETRLITYQLSANNENYRDIVVFKEPDQVTYPGAYYVMTGYVYSGTGYVRHGRMLDLEGTPSYSAITTNNMGGNYKVSFKLETAVGSHVTPYSSSTPAVWVGKGLDGSYTARYAYNASTDTMEGSSWYQMEADVNCDESVHFYWDADNQKMWAAQMGINLSTNAPVLFQWDNSLNWVETTNKRTKPHANQVYGWGSWMMPDGKIYFQTQNDTDQDMYWCSFDYSAGVASGTWSSWTQVTVTDSARATNMPESSQYYFTDDGGAYAEFCFIFDATDDDTWYSSFLAIPAASAGGTGWGIAL